MSAEELFEAGQGAFKAGDYENALSYFTRALLSSTPEDPLWISAVLLKGQCLRALARYREAEHFLRPIVAAYPDNSNLHVLYAWVADSSKDWVTAHRLWAAIRSKWPKNLGGYLGGARALEALGNFDGADQLFRFAFRHLAMGPDLLVAFAKSSEARGDWPGAKRRWEALQTLFPHEAIGFLGLADALAAMGQHDEARALIVEGSSLFPESRELIARADAGKRSGGEKAEDTVSSLLASLDAHPEDERVRLEAAIKLAQAGREGEAEKIIEAGLNLNEASLELAVAHAELAVRRSQFKRALPRWRKALKIGRRDRRAANGLTTALIRTGQFGAAEQLTKRLVERFADDVVFRNLHAMVATEMGNSEEALRRWKAAYHADPNSYWARDGLAHALLNLHRFGEARAVWKEAHDRGDNDIGILRLEARLAEIAGDWAAAVGIRSKVLERKPDDPIFLSELNAAQAQLSLEAVDAGNLGGVLAERPPEAGDGTAVADLLRNFESLGENCELGFVQRHFGLEPLSLLRWSGTRTEEIIAAMSSRFEGVGDPENVLVTTWPSGEYCIGDKRYGMSTHSFTYEYIVPREKFLKQQSKRIAFLRQKLIEDIELSNKIFVYKSPDISPDQTERLRSAIRAIGPSTLLIVKEQDSAHGAGTVELISDGLMVGYLDHMPPFEYPTQNVSMECWISICRKALQLWNENKLAILVTTAI